MTWAEFEIRSYAYHRQQKTEWKKVRRIAWASLIGPHIDPKRLPKNEAKYMPLGEEQSKGVSEESKTAYLEAYKTYLKQKNGGIIG